MYNYRHYIRPSSDGIIRYGFCDVQEDPQQGDLLVDDNAPRQFNLTLQDNKGQYLYKIVNGIMTLRSDAELFDLAQYKQDKINLLTTVAAGKLETFKSSALGSEHTYLSGMNDMLLLTGEYTYIKGDDYTGENPLWYTFENGNVEHTKAQFIQIYLDCRLNVQTVKYHQAIKNAQTNACTSKAQVDTIAWINPNPPSVPIELAGTVGATGSGQVTLNWTANTDITMVGGGGYNVYVDGSMTKVNTTLVTAATYTATGLAIGTHTFTISAVDTDGLESVKCTSISVTVS